MCDECTKRAFDELEDANLLLQRDYDRDSNLKIKAAQCAKIAEKYGGSDYVAVGILIVQVANLVTNRVLFTLEEPVYTDEIKGERTIKDCWLDTKDTASAVQSVNAFYLQYLAVVDRSTKQVLALHNV